MKTKISRAGKSSLSIVLALMMIISTMLIGAFTVDAASTNKFTKNSTIYFDINSATVKDSNSGDTWDSSSTIVALFYSWDNTEVYESINGSQWNKNYSGATISDDNKKIDFRTVGEAVTTVSGDIKSVKVPDYDYLGYVRFLRLDASTGYIWNYSSLMCVDGMTGGINGVKLNGWDDDSSWTTIDTSSFVDTSQTYYIRGEGTGLSWESTNAVPLTKSTDGTYSYFAASGATTFKIAKSNNSWDYGYDSSYVVNTVDGVATLTLTSSNDGNGGENIACNETGNYYIIVYAPGVSPNTSTTNPLIYASTTLPSGGTGGDTSNTLYLYGDFQKTNNWNTNYTAVPFTYDSTTGWYETAEVQFTGSTSTTESTYAFFRVYDATDSANKTVYGPNGTASDELVTSGVETTLTTSDSKAFKYSVGDTAKTVKIYVNLDTKKIKLVDVTVPTDKHTVTVKSNIKVTAVDSDGASTVINETGDSETAATMSLTASQLTLTAAAVDYNFAGWILGDGVTLVSGALTDKAITVNITADNAVITATSITLTPRLSVNSTEVKQTTARVEQNEVFTLNAISKVGDKNQKATKYTVDYYMYTTDVTSATNIASKTISNVDYTTLNTNLATVDGTTKTDLLSSEYLIGQGALYDASTTYSIADLGVYNFYADIKGYDSTGALVTGEYASVSLGTSLCKDTVTVTVAAPFSKATAYDSGLWVDVNQSVTDSSIALIKWTNKTGSTGGDTGNTYTLYVPGGVSLTLPVYYAFSSLTINGIAVSKGENYTFADNTSYTVVGDSTSYTLNVLQSTSASMLTTTVIDPSATSYIDEGDNLPTKAYSTKAMPKNKYSGTVMTMTETGATDIAPSTLSQIKGRGNSSWEASGYLYGKYAYNFKLASKTKVLGMPKAKSWCLLANNMDESGLRNIVTYQAATLAGLDNVPEFRVADFYNNGEYLGSYLITEKVDVGSSKLVDGKTAEDYYDLTGDGKTYKTTYTYNGSSYDYQYVNTGNLKAGVTSENLSYLLEFDLSARAQAEHCWFVTPKGQYVAVKAPEDLNQAEMEFIIKKWLDAEAAAYGTDYNAMNSLLDLDSFAQVYLVQEFTKNLDSGATSYYVYWDGSSVTTWDATDMPTATGDTSSVKWVATPIWDYDWALGGHGGTKNVNTGGSEASNRPDTETGWFAKYKYVNQYDGDSFTTYNLQAQLANNTEFWNTNVKNAWNSSFYDSLKAVFGTASTNDGYIYDAYSKNLASLTMNDARWGFITADLTCTADKRSNSSYGEDWGSIDTGDTLADCYMTLKNWGVTRMNWMNDRLAETAVSISLATDGVAARQTGDRTTLTTTVTRDTTYPITYTFYASTDNGANYTKLGSVTSAESAVTYQTPQYTAAGSYTFKVEATYATAAATYTKAEPSVTTTAVDVTQASDVRDITVYFKAPSAYMYQPTVTLNDEQTAKMTLGTSLGKIYSGELEIYWWTATLTGVDTSKANTFNFTMEDPNLNLNASITGTFAGSELYFGADNLLNDTVAVDLTNEQEYIRNYYYTPTHMVNYDAKNGVVLGFTNVDGVRYRMGTRLPTESGSVTPSNKANTVATLSIDSATSIQFMLAYQSPVSELQYALYDVDLSGKVDINDATYIQMALAKGV